MYVQFGVASDVLVERKLLFPSKIKRRSNNQKYQQANQVAENARLKCYFRTPETKTTHVADWESTVADVIMERCP